jgi:Baseplate J-like protein
MIYLCGQSNRRELVLAAPGLNGIDYLEVLGSPGCGTELAITFLKDATALALTSANVVVTGEDPVTVTSVTPATAQAAEVVTVQLDHTGDFAPYTLRLAAVQTAADGTVTVTPDPPAGLDPVLSTVTFSFKAGCPSPADCLPASTATPPAAPDVNYLARDYDSFRQVMLDRLAVLAPTWTERHAADLGLVLVEALAYAADHLSYQQDAVGTEAYLGTARSRISLRRHARLVNYLVGEGCNARALVAVNATQDGLTMPEGTLFYPAVPGLPVAVGAADPLAAQLAQTAPAFAALQAVPLATEQDEIVFYTWGDENCCLPAGATSATLTSKNAATDPQKGNLTSLTTGTILVFEEVLGPGTGVAEDADPAHRCAVMLTAVRWRDHTGAPLTDPVNGWGITQVSWADADALPVSLCLSSTVDGVPVGNVTVARGNIVLADQGTSVSAEELPPVPASGRYYPQLMQSPVTFAVPFGPPAPAPASAAAFLTQDPSQAVPVVSLTDSEGGGWTPQPDLLSSGPRDQHFVLEVEQDGTAFLRFGDGEHGAQPDPGLTFTPSYQVGNGTPGNVGRDALGQAVIPAVTPSFPAAAIAGIRNPLPVTDGVDMETTDHIRRFAPFAFQAQQRCVTEDDYGQQAALVPGVQAARGTLRWTGSWYTAFVSVEPAASVTGDVGSATPVLPAQLTAAVAQDMDLLRMMGTDVAVEAAIIVGLRIELAVCVDADHFRGDVQAALMTTFTGPGGLLNASDFTFGQTVYASPLIAAAQAVPGVASVTLAVFSRLDAPWVDGRADGFLTMGRLEIPRCDNDPDHLDHGLFTLALDGGK